MAKKRELTWGCIVCPTKLGAQRLDMSIEDYGIYLGKSGKLSIVIVKSGQKTPSKYHRSFWEFLEGQNS